MSGSVRHSSVLSGSGSGSGLNPGNLSEENDSHHHRHHPSSQTIQTIQQPSSGLRVPSNRKTIYDRHLNRSRNADLSRASFAYIFAEMVTYAQRRVTGIQDLERR